MAWCRVVALKLTEIHFSFLPMLNKVVLQNTFAVLGI